MTFSEPIESSSLTKCRNFINAFESLDSQTREDFFEDGKIIVAMLIKSMLAKFFPHYLVRLKANLLQDGIFFSRLRFLPWEILLKKKL